MLCFHQNVHRICLFPPKEYAYFLTKDVCTFGGVPIPCIYLPARWERGSVGSSGLHCVDATLVECC